MYNGLAFLCLGLMILQLWKVWRSTDQHYERLRIFLIAAVFASVTFFRGLMLVLFLFSNANKRVANMVHSSWGAPAVLFAEWWSIVLTLFVLPTLWSAKTADVEPESRSLRSSFGHGAGGKKPSIICSATSNREKAKTNDEHYAVNR
jgi:hypothetical protein